MWSAAVARGPFPQALNRDALFKARGDMHAGEIKAVKAAISVRQELPLLVAEGAAPELYKAAEDDSIEVGPFEVRRQLPCRLHSSLLCSYGAARCRAWQCCEAFCMQCCLGGTAQPAGCPGR
jgi:hypothetical protein